MCDDGDNCTFAYNPSQHDSDEDGVGDACDPACENVDILADSYIDKGHPAVTKKPWSEATVTWNNYNGGQPNTGILLGSALTIGPPLHRGHLKINLVGPIAVNDIANGLVVDQLPAANMNATVYRSRELPADDKPLLRLCYIVPE